MFTRETNSSIHHADDSDFQQTVLDSTAPVLVDFYADWCGPCRMLAPALEQVAREQPHAKVVKVNVDHSPRTAAKYGINAVPTLMTFRDGRPARQHIGLATKAHLEALLSS